MCFFVCVWVGWGVCVGGSFVQAARCSSVRAALLRGGLRAGDWAADLPGHAPGMLDVGCALKDVSGEKPMPSHSPTEASGKCPDFLEHVFV